MDILGPLDFFLDIKASDNLRNCFLISEWPGGNQNFFANESYMVCKNFFFWRLDGLAASRIFFQSESSLSSIFFFLCVNGDYRAVICRVFFSANRIVQCSPKIFLSETDSSAISKIFSQRDRQSSELQFFFLKGLGTLAHREGLMGFRIFCFGKDNSLVTFEIFSQRVGYSSGLEHFSLWAI